jgi:hypothetical protein
VNFSGRKVSKRVKESEFVAALLVVAKCLLQQLDHLANQDTLRAQYSLKHVELNSKLEQFNLLEITFTNAQYSISNAKNISALSIGLWSLLFMS